MLRKLCLGDFAVGITRVGSRSCPTAGLPLGDVIGRSFGWCVGIAGFTACTRASISLASGDWRPDRNRPRLAATE